MKKFFPFFFMIACFHTTSLTGQISSFPYIENFEASAGGWIVGGVSSSWAWGIPSDAVISAAGSGSRCWKTSLATDYNNSELSTLTSPLFDMSSLTSPIVSFMIFWESESTWDGAGFQYSSNGGTTWNDFPASGVSNCFRVNWYTHTIVNGNDFPSNNPGWSGNITAASGGGCVNGGGSAVWRTATHCLPVSLTGNPTVRFRFTFGSGLFCTDEGVAIDLFTISESPVSADFSELCIGLNEVEFEASSALPGCGIPFPDWSFTWNFGDPASGPSDIGSGWSASHVFTSPGTYSIQMIATNPCGAKDTVQKIVTVNGVSCALPFHSLNFHGEAVSTGVKLTWDVNATDKNDLFLLQSGTDAKSWAPRAEIVANYKRNFEWLDTGTQEDIWYKLIWKDEAGNTLKESMILVPAGTTTHTSLRVYPNPSGKEEDIFAIVSAYGTGTPSFFITDMNGMVRSVAGFQEFIPDGTTAFRISTRNMPAGLYVLTVNTGTSTVSQKFLISQYK